MSSEVKKAEENKAIEIKEEDDVKEKDVEEVKEVETSLGQKIKDQWQLILKIIQLVFCCLCLGMYFPPANQSANLAKHHLEQVGLIFLAFIGYILINAVFIVSRCLKDKIPFRISALFSLIAALLFFVSGILLIVDRRDKFQGTHYEPHMYLASMLSAATVFSFVNAVLFAVDGVYTFILKLDF
ncbi:unnamed protein product [Ceutorhynchus assimilis]|uniref:MARVEL domain-containing protein n=1 Tax=Ceutorhynchus assimilis TaxID=467358 RepID=A0A9N9QSM4_9CUCU|nr:unnamed protein product [Ceutorhynchus assimilis]